MAWVYYTSGVGVGVGVGVGMRKRRCVSEGVRVEFVCVCVCMCVCICVFVCSCPCPSDCLVNGKLSIIIIYEEASPEDRQAQDRENATVCSADSPLPASISTLFRLTHISPSTTTIPTNFLLVSFQVTPLHCILANTIHPPLPTCKGNHIDHLPTSIPCHALRATSARQHEPVDLHLAGKPHHRPTANS
jgi:hypothetical protein